LRTGGRAAAVVARVLRATLVELARVGYARLRVEEIAARAGVNKTTVYRRWPTHAQLVDAALREGLARTTPPVPDTGSLRGDLLALLREQVESARSPLRRGIVRVLHAERAEADLEVVVRAIREERRARRLEVVRRGVERGELPPATDTRLLLDLVFAPLFARLYTWGEPVDDRFLEDTVDVVLAGIRARYA